MLSIKTEYVHILEHARIKNSPDMLFIIKKKEVCVNASITVFSS